jgi:hypothetical protein
VTPGFADERIFVPRAKERIIACFPRRRRMEHEVICHMLARLRPAGPAWDWRVLNGVSEREVAHPLRRLASRLSAQSNGRAGRVHEAYLV